MNLWTLALRPHCDHCSENINNKRGWILLLSLGASWYGSSFVTRIFALLNSVSRHGTVFTG